LIIGEGTKKEPCDYNEEGGEFSSVIMIFAGGVEPGDTCLKI